MAKIDFTGVGKPIEAGKYTAVAEAKYVPMSKSSGQPAISFEWTLNDGMYEGRKMFRSYSLQANSLVFLKRVLIAHGIDPDDLDQEMDIDDIIEQVNGKEVELEVEVGEYQNEPNNNVKNVREVGASVF